MKRLILPCFLLSCIFIVGCSPKNFVAAAGKMGQVIWDPSTEVGSKEDQPSMVTLSIYATDTVNPNPYSLPPPEEENLNEVTLNFSAESEEEMRKQLEEALAAIGPQPPPVERQLTWRECHLRNNPICDYLTFKVDDKYALPTEELGTPIFEIPLFTQQAESERCREFLALGEYSEYGSRPGPLVVTTDPSPLKPSDVWSNQDPALLRAMATPISFKIIQLKDDSLFLNADHDTLSSDLKGALGTTYITHDDYVLTPAQFKYIADLEIDKKTRYIAVYADFYEMEAAIWKGIVQIEPIGGRLYHLIAVFQSNQVSLQQEGAPPPK